MAALRVAVGIEVIGRLQPDFTNTYKGVTSPRGSSSNFWIVKSAIAGQHRIFKRLFD